MILAAVFVFFQVLKPRLFAVTPLGVKNSGGLLSCCPNEATGNRQDVNPDCVVAWAYRRFCDTGGRR